MDRNKTTPLHLTAIHGHPRLASLLLEHKPPADVALEDKKGRNALELAIIHNNKPVAEVIIDSPCWRSAMESCHVEEEMEKDEDDEEEEKEGEEEEKEEAGEAIPDTPMRMLIRTFPDLAQRVFDKCIKKVKSGKLQLDYTLLEDTFALRKEVKGYRYVSYSPDVPDVSDVKTPYHPDGEIIKANHCLMLMVQNRQKHLLKHPLCLGLLRHKWRSFGKYVFYFQFLLYCLFLSSIIAYTMSMLQPDSWPAPNFENIEVADTAATTVFRYLVFIFVGINIIIEILQLAMVSFFQ